VIKVNGQRFLITHGLFRALSELRHPNKSRLLWIDAISINQADTEERHLQVQQMRHIYSHAHRVIVWLGNAPNHLDVVFHRCERIARVHDQHKVAEELSDIQSWKNSLTDLIRRGWWKRVWVLQEVALAKRVVIKADQLECSWDDISNAIMAIRKKPETSLVIDKDVCDFIIAVQDLKSTTSNPPLGLTQLACTFRNRKATDERDKLYALMGLLKSTAEESIKPDYSISSRDLFLNFTLSSIMRYQHLGLFAFRERQKFVYPSWPFLVVDWGQGSDRTSSSSLWTGGLTKSPLTLDEFCADGGKPANFQKCPENSAALLVRGLLVDYVELVGDDKEESAESFSFRDESRLATAIESWECLAGGPWPASNKYCPERKSFHRTLVCSPNEEEDVSWKLWLNREPQEGIGITEFVEKMRINMWNIAVNDRPNEEFDIYPDHDLTDSLKTRMQLCCQRRGFFKTVSGRFGLGPVGVCPGDCVAILFGSAVPIILRPSQNRVFSQQSWLSFLDTLVYKYNSNLYTQLLVNFSRSTASSSASEEQSFRFIGQSYVDGIMKYAGSSIEDGFEAGRLKLQEFRII
jgi:hypothetical protein